MKSTEPAFQFPQYKTPEWPTLEEAILKYWETHQIFEKSLRKGEDMPAFTFYEGPPSANGMPGIHHVMSRSIKDIFCRYKTQKGFKVQRKGGWDTHGLPVELQVEKRLGITKDDIGVSISIADYNAACKKDVMQYKEVWDDLTRRIGFWLDLENPYITYENSYIESVWHLLSQFYHKGLLYKGHSIQPYSPAAGTGLSSHELNQPGCYKEVKDTSVVAQFLCKPTPLFADREVCFLAWTTTPWTLPSNTALAVGSEVDYVVVETYNPYTLQPVSVVLAANCVARYFAKEGEHLPMELPETTAKMLPWRIVQKCKGKALEGLAYEQLLPYVKPEGKAFHVLCGDFVTTEDGTGIVHIAPSFGSDDFKLAQKHGFSSLTLVNEQGKFVPQVTDFAGEYVKQDYYSEEEKEKERKRQGKDRYLSVDERIAIKLKEENKAFKVEKYSHNYPHCWRTDKPILYYPLQSWFIKTTAIRDRLVELNQQVNWKPRSTGEGRFANWLENLVDWNLSRSRFWGTPLPIWRTEDGTEEKCIGSMDDLKAEIDKAIAAGVMHHQPLSEEWVDLHRSLLDTIVLISDTGKPMRREEDLIDVWFDSGAMPYAQWHFPFENKEQFEQSFPADFIAEGVDQTRGWFFTLHVIAVALFDSVAYKNVLANGLVLDKHGNKMSKRLNNAIDPFKAIKQYGADAIRWYMMSNAQPWDNLKFDLQGVEETQRKFFGTLYNTYSFFALYANVDGFAHREALIPLHKRPEIDRWICSLLNSLIEEVDRRLSDYDPTGASRAIQEFVDVHLSNWYVRLCRRRFWKGEYSDDKIAAYQTLYHCLLTVSRLMAPVAPFYAERLYLDLTSLDSERSESVHLSDFPQADAEGIDKDLETRMQLAQDVSSMVLSIRKKEQIKVRQPLQTIMIPVLDPLFKQHLQQVEDLILSEVNVKEIHYLEEKDSHLLVKKAKPVFKELGKKAGPMMKELSQLITAFGSEEISKLEKEGSISLMLSNNTPFELLASDVEVMASDIPGWTLASEGRLTVALDVTITEELLQEGIGREVVNRIQNIRKDKSFDLQDKIIVRCTGAPKIISAINAFKSYICAEILAVDILTNLSPEQAEFDLEVEGEMLQLDITKV
jgi:isoleucyl-tRNA synthetase